MSNHDTDTKIDLNGHVAIVTGGGRGIGRAMALALAEAGAAVAVVARTADQLAGTVALVEEAGGRAVAFPADVTDQRAIERAVAQVERQLGPLDLLVNNAAIGGQIGPAWTVDVDQWWRCMDVNLRGPFLCSRAVLPGMIARRRGRIINTASEIGLAPWAYVSGYAVSKAAAIRLSENLAAEVKEHGVSVFAIHPGEVPTAMWEAAAADPGDEKWLGGDFRRILEEGYGIPPEEAADLVVLLASGQADALSGCFISVDDDVTAMVRRAEEIQQEDLYTLRLRTAVRPFA